MREVKMKGQEKTVILNKSDEDNYFDFNDSEDLITVMQVLDKLMNGN